MRSVPSSSDKYTYFDERSPVYAFDGRSPEPVGFLSFSGASRHTDDSDGPDDGRRRARTGEVLRQKTTTPRGPATSPTTKTTSIYVERPSSERPDETKQNCGDL